MSIMCLVLGFEHTTSLMRVSYHDHYTSVSSLTKKRCMALLQLV